MNDDRPNLGEAWIINDDCELCDWTNHHQFIAKVCAGDVAFIIERRFDVAFNLCFVMTNGRLGFMCVSRGLGDRKL